MKEAIHFRGLCSVPPPLLSPSFSKHHVFPNPLHKISTFSPLKSLPQPPTPLATNNLISPPAAVSPPDSPRKTPSTPTHFPFLEKMLYLDSVGIDLFALIEDHPPIVSSSLADLRAAVDSLLSLGFSSADLRRMCGMCPEILTAGGPPAFNAVLAFLLREAGVRSSDLCYVLSRRPRLLVSSVACRLRPTLNFLQMLGVSDPGRHAHLLSCSVEDKFLPRLEFLQKVGFSSMEARFMARRFPQIFCYSIKENLEPKVEFFLGTMERELREIKLFPQYFSFSLDKKIKPRHCICKQNGVFFELPALLKHSDAEFQRRLDVCVSSSSPSRRSPLWKEGLSDDCL
ncbi:transcription termination factor MTEF1, chloroplastic-like [Phalaenopsis equestris]|uniref:transcription termination factor MTEF1, chloroplastic-like n=1 Tax=Phalaenopsis equestris TaxID=78828 RepID=UPI0009E64469|nr:transcription termination factor MTEF1, chloroplastic-like [Phalaenopsis equestris]